MAGKKPLQYWSVWYPKAAATGLLIARGLIDPTDTLLLHAAPEFITVEVTDEDGDRLAFGKDLKQTQDSPICRLAREGDRVLREDIWPTEVDFGKPVMLPGGEVGILLEWHNASDHTDWRWKLEFYNSIR